MSGAVVRRVLTGLLLLGAGPGYALASAPAAGAAKCTSSGGVSVVVDYRELGGDTITACAVQLDDTGRLDSRHIRRLTELRDELARRRPRTELRLPAVAG